MTKRPLSKIAAFLEYLSRRVRQTDPSAATSACWMSDVGAAADESGDGLWHMRRHRTGSRRDRACTTAISAPAIRSRYCPERAQSTGLCSVRCHPCSEVIEHIPRPERRVCRRIGHASETGWLCHSDDTARGDVGTVENHRAALSAGRGLGHGSATARHLHEPRVLRTRPGTGALRTSFAAIYPCAHPADFHNRTWFPFIKSGPASVGVLSRSLVYARRWSRSLCRYNRPDRLQVALSSILAQTYQDFEIIVVNDGTLDERRDRPPCSTGTVVSP